MKIKTWNCAQGLILAMGLLFLNMMAYAGSFDSPVGYWRTYDGISHKPISIVEFYKMGQELRGKVVKVNYYPNGKAATICRECKGARRNRPVKGMTIIWNLRQQGNKWVGGKILDPNHGNIYACWLMLTPDGNAVKLRAFMGVSMLGRTVHWVRMSTQQVAKILH